MSSSDSFGMSSKKIQKISTQFHHIITTWVFDDWWCKQTSSIHHATTAARYDNAYLPSCINDINLALFTPLNTICFYQRTAIRQAVFRNVIHRLTRVETKVYVSWTQVVHMKPLNEDLHDWKIVFEHKNEVRHAVSQVVHYLWSKITITSYAIFRMPILDEILILIFILAHVDRVLATASFEVVDHLCWCLNRVLNASIVVDSDC